MTQDQMGAHSEQGRVDRKLDHSEQQSAQNLPKCLHGTQIIF